MGRGNIGWQIANMNDNERLIAGTASGKGPSPKLWSGCPLLPIMLDPTKGFYYFNDFMGEIDATTGDGWTINAQDSGTISGVADLEGGALFIDSAGHASAHDGVNAQLKNCSVKPQAGVKIYFEARVKMLNTGLDEYFIGLADTCTDIIEQTNGLLDDTVDKVGFFRDHGASPADDKLSFVTARTDAEDETADIATVADDTWVKLGFIIDGLSSITFFVDGEIVGVCGTPANIPNAAIDLSFVSQTDQSDTDAELTIDWVRLAQVGGRN